jgi:hypothetical protein
MKHTRAITAANRVEIVRDVETAINGTRVTIDAPKRTNEQNKLLWVLLNKISAKVEHAGRKLPPDIWKAVFMFQLGKEVEFVPSLDGEIVALGYRSSELSKEDMSNLIELIYSENAQRWRIDLDAPP